MQISVSKIDEEIRETENRIALERVALEDAVHGCSNSLREAVASPKTLLAVLGVGFAVGKILFSGKKQPAPVIVQPPKSGILGVLTGLAGTAMSLMQPNSGVGGLARWAIQRALAPGGASSSRASSRPVRTSSVSAAPAQRANPPTRVS
jgi:hypothetical protein